MSDARYRYDAGYVPDAQEFRARVLDKTVVPHQVEFQPGPMRGALCWLRCPYCYGRSAEDTGERISRERLLDVLEEVADGGVRKVIFAGYCTDPLNYDGLEDMIEVAIARGMAFGVYTKALHVSDRFLRVRSSARIVSRSWVSVSVDAGTDATYCTVHGIANRFAQVYSRVWANVVNIAQARKASGAGFDVAATYLMNGANACGDDARRFVSDFRKAGCNVLRLAFPQLPRKEAPEGSAPAPSAEECTRWAGRLAPLVAAVDNPECRVLLVDADAEHGLFRKKRTLPCVARFVFPTVGFDGWLYPCSQSAAPSFRGLALGDLAERGFWECFDDYHPEWLNERFNRDAGVMGSSGCRCDRKAHLVNGAVGRSCVFAEEFLNPEGDPG